MAYEKIVNEAKSLMERKCEEKRKAGALSKVHEESHMTAVAIYGSATARALAAGQNCKSSDIELVSDLTKIAGYLHDCEREATERVPHGEASAEFVKNYWETNTTWKEAIPFVHFEPIIEAIKAHEGSFKDISNQFGSPIQNKDGLLPLLSVIAHSIVAGDKAFEASGYRVLERRAFFVGKERTEKGDLKDVFKYPDESHLSVLGETMIRLYARNPIDTYPNWLKPFAQEWHAIQYQLYKGLLTYVEFDEIKAAQFFLEKKFPKFDQKLFDQIKLQQHLSGKYFDKAKYPILASEIDKLNEMLESEKSDLASSSLNLVMSIAIQESPEEAIETYKKLTTGELLSLKNYRRFFDGIIAYREGTEEFVKKIEEKIKVEVENSQ